MSELVEYLAATRGVARPGDVRWAHAVNSDESLTVALNNPAVDFIEVDVNLSESAEPIAAHPPAIVSDLSISQLLARMGDSDVGLKLDFKATETVLPVLGELAVVDLKQPVMLNADVVGMYDTGPAGIDARWFIDLCQRKYERGVLSLGWRTSGKVGSKYTEQSVNEMLAYCEDLTEVTFPVRACMAVISLDALKNLTRNDNRTLTLWNSGRNQLDAAGISWIREHTDPEECFYDLDAH